MSLTTCSNPRCTCDPCGCADCACGAARLGELERRVIDILWSGPEQEWSVRDVATQLPDYAYTTIATVLDRLVRKQLVNRRLLGRTVLFAPASTPADHASRVMLDALVMTSDPDEALAAFASSLSRAQRELLRRSLRGGARP